MCNRIISLRDEAWAHKTSLTRPCYYWTSCIKPGNCAVMYLFVRSIDFAFFYDFFLLDFGTVPIVWYFWFRNCSDSLVFLYFILDRMISISSRNYNIYLTLLRCFPCIILFLYGLYLLESNYNIKTQLGLFILNETKDIHYVGWPPIV